MQPLEHRAATAGVVCQPADGQFGVIVGVDTHLDQHTAAVVDATGRSLGWRSFPTTVAGYQALVNWAASFGHIERVGVEGSGCWGLGLTRHLRAQGVPVIEVLRPDRRDRRNRGKSDALDAEAAARAVLSGQAVNLPKTRDGAVEAIRVLKMTRDSAVKARTAAGRQLESLVVTAPEPLRSQLASLKFAELISVCAALSVDPDRLDEPGQAIRQALGVLARRHQQLTVEQHTADRQLAALVRHRAPQLLQRPGIGVQTAATLLITVGDNPDRVRSEAAMAHLCGTAPLPASSGRIVRHRFNPGGDRQANHALYIIVVTRMRIDQRTRDYVTRRTAQGLSKPEIIRCLKRYVAREVHHLLIPATPAPPI